MNPNNSLLNFNKELIFGEVGAMVGAPLTSVITALFTKSPNIISIFAVLGGLVGGALFWLLMRSYDKKKIGTFSMKNLAVDVAYFTPVAFIISMILYQPILFTLSRKLMLMGDIVLLSVFLAQLIAFLSFLVAINIYRYFLLKFSGKAL